MHPLSFYLFFASWPIDAVRRGFLLMFLWCFLDSLAPFRDVCRGDLTSARGPRSVGVATDGFVVALHFKGSLYTVTVYILSRQRIALDVFPSDLIVSELTDYPLEPARSIRSAFGRSRATSFTA